MIDVYLAINIQLSLEFTYLLLKSLKIKKVESLLIEQLRGLASNNIQRFLKHRVCKSRF